MIRPRRARGLTVTELMVTIVVAALLLTLAVPSLRDFILMQRLRSINAQLVTDLQYARSEAAARNQYVRLEFRMNDARSCYVIYVSGLNANRCECLSAEGSVCAAGATALRTVRLPASDGVRLRLPNRQAAGFAFDHISGGIVSTPSDLGSEPLSKWSVEAYLDSTRVLRNVINQSGRVSVCAPSSTTVGAPAC
ncbi:MAG: hypothetical protein Fur0014_03530 [Rubrivivax sp.]